MSTTTQNLQALADAFISTDRQSARKDVLRLGMFEAGQYHAEIASGQPYYSDLAKTADGWEAIKSALKSVMFGVRVSVKGEVGAIERIDGDGALIGLDSGDVIIADIKELQLVD